ncbi:MAG TPA: DUF4962 domain-containing protein [Planctomycetota bacterium]|jgi:hypothetical protein
MFKRAMMALFALATAFVFAGDSATVQTWDFTTKVGAWTPRADTVKLQSVADLVLPNALEKKAGLRIQGRMNANWNYACSDARPMQAGQLYRLTAWLRVEKLGEGTPPPFLKCEFVSAEKGRELGRMSTPPYDTAKLGQWQAASAEFRAPEGVARCWIALEKGTEGAAEIDATLAEVRIEPIARFTHNDKYILNPVPVPLASRKGVHPRLYLDATRIDALRQAVKTTHAPLWKEVQAQADAAVKSGPPAYIKQDKYSGDEQLYQRNVGNAMPLLAISYLISKERKYLDSARDWARASCGYATWGLGQRDGMDLAAGHQLYGLALVYDWCYADLDDDTRALIRQTLAKRAAAMFEAAASGKIWWSKSYLQNHLWVNICGMAAAGLVLFDENDEALKWIGLPLEKFRRTMDSLGPDGASHEGVGYWGYGVEYMLKFMHLSRELLVVDLYGCDWWRNTAAYRQYLALPRNAWTPRNNIVDIADCPRGNWYGPDYLLRGLAREFNDGYAQWLGAQIDTANVDSPEARWLNLIWYDPSVPEKSPADLPTLRRFDDMEIVSARSDWSGDESLVVFKCGPFIGHHAVQNFAYDPGGGHVHPDAGHFVVFGAGEWLIRDDAYSAKLTSQHNTLLIGGKGQLGEGQTWFVGSEPLAAKARPKILRADSSPALDHIAGDATEAYPRKLGVKRFVRHLLYIKPDVLLVLDDIALEKPAPLELRLHTEQPLAKADDGTYVARGVKAMLRVEPLTANGLKVEVGEDAIKGEHGSSTGKLTSLRLRCERGEWRNATACTWSVAGQQPARIGLKADGERWTFSIGPRTLLFDGATGEAKLTP